jgi:hypothetical protein
VGDSEIGDRPGGNIELRLLELHDSAKSSLGLAARLHAPALGRLLQQDVDIGVWETRLLHRPETRLVSDARRELGFAIYSAASGLYMQAYSTLRLFLELSFAAVSFSVDEVLRRQWLADRTDFRWSKALDEKDGVLAPAFVREFYPRAATDAPHYRARAAELYRHCSQFIHGKTVATSALPKTLSYSEDVLLDWCSTARGSAEAVLYVLYCRYADELLPADDGQLANTLEFSFSHLRSVRESFNTPVEGTNLAG